MSNKKKLTSLNIMQGTQGDILILYADEQATAKTLAGDVDDSTIFTAFHHMVSPGKSAGNVIIYLEDGIPTSTHISHC